jgi:hypothetical protein
MARRPRGDRGAVLLELALILGFLALVFSSVVDLGLGWRRSIEVSNTLRSGGRVVSNLGEDRNADIEALRSLNAGIAEIGAANVNRVIIYKATSVDGDVPAACTALTPAGSSTNGIGIAGTSGVFCNVYSPSQLANLTSARFSGSATSCQSDDWDRFYCPPGREGDQGASAGADFVGIWIEVEYEYIVGLLPGDGITISDNIVMRIEPRPG